MSESSHLVAFARPMKARDPNQQHRVSTPLELLLDLCFVVAVAQAASGLHHGLREGHAAHAITSYALVFFAVWWAWMNFTWFASSYDTDDVLYRLKVMLQIAGSLVLAAGVPRAFERQEWSVVTLGYSIMRIALIAHWVRVARDDLPRRGTSLRYITGLVLCQLGWIALALLPVRFWIFGWCVLMPAECLTPIIAERHAPTMWHAHHIAERFGLLTLIVLGESITAATVAIQAGVDSGSFTWRFLALALGALVLVFSMWWLYFDHESPQLLVSTRRAFVWGYGHYFLFASTAAVGAGLGASVDSIASPPSPEVGAGVALPVAIYVVTVWLLVLRPLRRSRLLDVACWVSTALVALASYAPAPVPTIAAILAGLVSISLLTKRH